MVVKRVAELVVNVNARKAEQQVDGLEKSVDQLRKSTASGFDIKAVVDDGAIDTFVSDLRQKQAEIKVQAAIDRQETSKLVKTIESQLKGIEADIDLDPSEAKAEADRLRASIKDIKIEAELNAGDARSEIKAIGSELRALDNKSIDVDADVSKAQTQIKSIDTDPKTIDVDADVSKAESAISGIKPEPLSLGIDSAGLSAGIGTAIGSAGGVVAAGFLALGAAGAAALATGFAGALSLEASNDKLSARLGLTPAESQKLGEAAASVYAGAWGESVDEVNATLRGIAENGLLDVEKSSKASFESAAQSALDLANVLDADVNEVTRAAGQLYKTGLADSAEEAFDLIAAGAQNGGDATGELLETVIEYAVNWEEAGFSGEQAMSQITQAAAGSTFELGKLGDLIKESGIRLGVLSDKELLQVSEATGLAASEIQKLSESAKEGDSVSFLKLIQSVKDIESTAEQGEAAVALFGTPFEDLSKTAFLDVDFSAKLEGIAGSATELGETVNDNLLTKLEALKRQGFIKLSEAADQYLLPAIDRLIPVFENFGGITGPIIATIIEGLYAFDAAIVATMGGDYEGRVEGGFISFMAEAGNILVTDVLPVVEQLKTLILDGVVPSLIEFATGVSEQIMPVAIQFAELFRDELGPAILELGEVLIDDLLPPLLEIAETFVAFAQGTIEKVVFPAVEAIVKVFREEVVPVIERDVIPAVEEAATVFESLRPVFDVIATIVGAVVVPAFEFIARTVVNVFGSVLRIITGAVSVIRGLLSGDVSAIVSGFGKIFSGLVGLVRAPFDAIAAVIRARIGDISNNITAGFRRIASSVAGVSGPVRGLVDLIKLIPNALPNPFRNFSMPSISLPNIPGFAFGGINKTPTLAFLSEFGHEEAVIPTGASVDYIKGILAKSSNDVLGRLYADFESNQKATGPILNTTTSTTGGTNNVYVTVQDHGRRSRGERLLAANMTASAIVRRLQPLGL